MRGNLVASRWSLIKYDNKFFSCKFAAFLGLQYDMETSGMWNAGYSEESHDPLRHISCKSHELLSHIISCKSHMTQLWVTWPSCESHDQVVRVTLPSCKSHITQLWVTWPSCKSHMTQCLRKFAVSVLMFWILKARTHPSINKINTPIPNHVKVNCALLGKYVVKLMGLLLCKAASN